MPQSTQISAFVTETTKEELERYTRKTGVKKQHLIEDALVHHLGALRELPTDIIVHPRLVVSAASGRSLAARLQGKPEPTAKLRALMAARDDD